MRSTPFTLAASTRLPTMRRCKPTRTGKRPHTSKMTSAPPLSMAVRQLLGARSQRISAHTGLPARRHSCYIPLALCTLSRMPCDAHSALPTSFAVTTVCCKSAAVRRHHGAHKWTQDLHSERRAWQATPRTWAARARLRHKHHGNGGESGRAGAGHGERDLALGQRGCVWVRQGEAVQRHGRRPQCIHAAKQPQGAAVHCSGVAVTRRRRRRRARGVHLCSRRMWHTGALLQCAESARILSNWNFVVCPVQVHRGLGASPRSKRLWTGPPHTGRPARSCSARHVQMRACLSPHSPHSHLQHHHENNSPLFWA